MFHLLLLVALVATAAPFVAVKNALLEKCALFKCQWLVSLDPSARFRQEATIEYAALAPDHPPLCISSMMLQVCVCSHRLLFVCVCV
jgi:hypothetical protein